MLTTTPQPLALIDVFDPLVYGPMTLVILGFTEAASRRHEHRMFYLLGAILPTLITLAEVGWSTRGLLSCGDDAECTAMQEVYPSGKGDLPEPY